MRIVKGVYNGETVVPQESLDVPPDTEIRLLVPGRSENAFADLLDELDNSIRWSRGRAHRRGDRGAGA